MSKQTAVEWLVEHLNLDETSPNYNNLTIKKAIEIEKDQIMNSWAKGVISDGDMTAEQYYDETYNK